LKGYQINPYFDAALPSGSKGSKSTKGDTTLEQYVRDRASDNIFHQELVELEYKFWENNEERL